MKPFVAPLYNQIKEHMITSPLGFHVPGHQYGEAMDVLKSIDQEAASHFRKVMELDVTELESTDDLHDPHKGIAEAQRLAASTFGAEESFFLVGGSTAGNIAVLLSVVQSGETVIVQRNVHKSIINGLKLAGAKAVFVTPQVDEQTNLLTIPSLKLIKTAIEMYPEAKAVILTNPNYYGIGHRLEQWTELVHQYRIPLIVDEAHGAHYGFHSRLPQSALMAGADAVVQSAHKTLPALTMSAILHVQGLLIDRDLLRYNLTMVQSSSPSFPMLISMDISRAMIDFMGERLFEPSIELAEQFRQWMLQRKGRLRCAVSSSQTVSQPVSQTQTEHQTSNLQRDPLRILIYDDEQKWSGFQLQAMLASKGIWTEMSNEKYTVLIITIGMKKSAIERLKHAVYIIEETGQNNSSVSPINDLRNEQIEERISSLVQFNRMPISRKDTVIINIDQAAGKYAAEAVIPYPPGIPLLYEGEAWTRESIAQVRRLTAAGARFQGASDITMNLVPVRRD